VISTPTVRCTALRGMPIPTSVELSWVESRRVGRHAFGFMRQHARRQSHYRLLDTVDFVHVKIDFFSNVNSALDIHRSASRHRGTEGAAERDELV